MKKVIIFCMVVGCVVSLNASAGVVAYYSFDVNAADDSGNGHDGVLSGVSITTDAERGNVLNGGDGGGVYLPGTNNTDNWLTNMLMQSHTVMMWVKLDSWGDAAWSPTLFTKYPFQLNQRNLTSTWRWQVGTDGTAPQAIYGAPDYADGEWHHVAATTNTATGKSKIYVDAVEMGSADFTGNLSNSSYLAWIGTGSLVGQIDDAYFLDEALDEAGIKELAGIVPEPATLALLGMGAMALFARRRRA